MKLGITGSRTAKSFDFAPFLNGGIDAFQTFLGNERIETVLVGGARGIDEIAESCARQSGIAVERFLPDYRVHRRGAPLRRNEEIVANADAILAVWNGDAASRGTLYTIDYALHHGKRVFLVKLGETAGSLVGEISPGWRPF